MAERKQRDPYDDDPQAKQRIIEELTWLISRAGMLTHQNFYLELQALVDKWSGRVASEDDTAAALDEALNTGDGSYKP